MLKMDPARSREALEQVEQAVDDHAEWYENLLRAVFCGAPCDRKDLDAAAHRLCRFGHWYFERAAVELREQPAFAAIGLEHERLHRLAARLLRDVVDDAPVVRADFEELVASSARLRVELESLRRAIEGTVRERDALTGAYGRAEMLRELRELRDRARRGESPSCLVLMDVDHLKQVNDTYGHPVGDGVLAGAVRYLDDNLRPGDKVFRYGGDEFLIALPEADLAVGQAVVRRVREGLSRRLVVVGPGGETVHVSASFGLASLDPEVGVLESIDRADQALLLAKAAGRGRAISWDPSVTTGRRLPRLKTDDVPR